MVELNLLKASRALVMTAFIAMLSFTASSYADETTTRHFGTNASPFTIDEYARVGTKIKITTDEFLAQDASATIECTGGAGKGGWRVTETTGLCWSEYTVADCDADSCVERTISANPVDNNDVILHAFHKCTAPSLPKNYCTHNYSGGEGVTGETGDDMFKITADGGGVFFEYKNLSETDPDRLRYLEWNSAAGGNSGKGLMIPSGPPSTMSRTDSDGNTITVKPYDDYRSFMANKPSFITVDKGCFPVTLSLCKEEPPSGTGLMEDGVCGVANGSSYPSQIAIGAGDYCNAGTRGTVTEGASPGQIQWTCQGLPLDGGGADSGTCTANITVPAPFCGGDHMSEISSLSVLQSKVGTDNEEDLCSVGDFKTSAGFTTTDDGWTWSCTNGIASQDVYCGALKESSNCESLQTNTNVILVQDTSGSFSDDIPNIRSAFIDLFNQPAMLDWQIGITHYNTTLSGGYDSLTPGFLSNHGDKSAILGHIQNLSNLIDGSEDPFVGLKRAVDEYTPLVPTGESYTVILVSDETDEGAVEAGGSGNVADYFDDAKAAMIANDVKFMVLATSSVSGFYTTHSSQIPEGQTLIISSDSSDLAAAMLAGLIDVNCE